MTYNNQYATYSSPKNECHYGNPLVFTTHDGIQVHAGGSSRGGGWWKMEPLPDLALGPDNEVRKGYATLDVKTKVRNMDGWSCLDTLVAKQPPAVIEMDFPDYNVPQDCNVDFWVALANDIRDRDIKVIHTMCMGGHGRTGIQLACLRWHLATDEERKAWPDSHTLIMDIREAYCTKAVEADSQQAYVARMCGIPLGQKLSFHKGYTYTSSYSTASSAKKKDVITAHNRSILECSDCDFCTYEDGDEELEVGDFCYDYQCHGKLVDVTEMMVSRISSMNVKDACLCLTTLDVTSELNVMKVGLLSRDLMQELHGKEWPSIMQKLFNEHGKKTLRGMLLRMLNKELLGDNDSDREDIIVCITDSTCDDRMSEHSIPDYSKKSDLKFTSRSFVDCGFCNNKVSPNRMSYAYQTGGDNNKKSLEHICSDCIKNLGDIELQMRIEKTSDGAIHQCQPVLVKDSLDGVIKGHLIESISPNYAIRLATRRPSNKNTIQTTEYWDDDYIDGKYTKDTNKDKDYSDDETLSKYMDSLDGVSYHGY